MVAIKNVGFVGLGIMGKPMAKNLLKEGFTLNVRDHFRPPIDELVSDGATAADSARACAEGVDAIVTMLPDSADSEQYHQLATPGTDFGDLIGEVWQGVL